MISYLILLGTTFCIIHVVLGALAQNEIKRNTTSIQKIVNKMKE